MADPCKVEGCVQRTDRLARSLRVQKEGCEERLRVQKEEHEQQKEEYEERLRLQKEEHEQQKDEYEERLRVQKEDHDVQKEKHAEAMVTRMKEMEERLTRDITSACEQRLRVQKEEHERALLVEQDATVKYYGYYPLPLDRFPLEIIALIADFVHDFDDLASMALVSRHVHYGVLLSRQWIVVEELVAAGPSAAYQKLYLHNRSKCAHYACQKGLLRCLRAMNLSRDEVTHSGCSLVVKGACRYGQLDVLKYLHTTYALRVKEFSLVSYSPGRWRRAGVMAEAAKHLPVLKYLHSVMGFRVQQEFPLSEVAHCLELLKFIHSISDVATADRSMTLQIAARSTLRRDSCGGTSCGGCGACTHERLVYLRDVYGFTKKLARYSLFVCQEKDKRSIREVFDIEE